MLPDSVRALVARFDEQKADYKRGSYNETQVRREFIDPFFKALGWDVDNKAGYSEAYKDVFHEARVRLDTGQSKAPDYAFRIGGVRKFFVEAKKPSVDIKGSPAPAFQVRRYAWSDPDVPLAILTDFEEFAVYDGRINPDKKDSAGNARLFYCTYEEYEDCWDEIEGLFARESILRCAFDRFADDKKKRGTEAPGDAFLKEIEGWRERLAVDMAQHNPALSARALGQSVQRIIDTLCRPAARDACPKSPVYHQNTLAYVSKRAVHCLKEPVHCPKVLVHLSKAPMYHPKALMYLSESPMYAYTCTFRAFVGGIGWDRAVREGMREE